jgi:cell division septation protein DedD
VADLTHDSPDDGFHEIQLSGKQLVFLFMATTVVSVVIFLCGVLVGRGVRAERAAEMLDPAVAAVPAPTDTVAEAQPAASEPPATEPPPPAETAADPSLSPSKESASSTETPAAAPRASAEESKPRRAAAVPAAVDPAPAPVPAPETRKRAAAVGPATAGPVRGTWVVQIVALRDRGMASSIVQRLNGKGYPAFVVNPTAGTPAPVFKVQVGRYADRGEAEQVARRLEKEEQFKPWVSR